MFFFAASKWVLGTLLGKGTYGHVYLALDQSTGEMIAVKQVEKRNKNAQGLEFVLLLRKEQQILQGLDHPNIVAYLGSEETPTHLSMYVVRSFVRGVVASRVRRQIHGICPWRLHWEMFARVWQVQRGSDQVFHDPHP